MNKNYLFSATLGSSECFFGLFQAYHSKFLPDRKILARLAAPRRSSQSRTASRFRLLINVAMALKPLRVVGTRFQAKVRSYLLSAARVDGPT